MSRMSGKGWSYAALIFGAGISLLGNITHTVLAETTIALGIRLPLAIVWPVALFIGVEVLVRVNWSRNSLLHWIGRFVIIIPVSAVAGVVSYRHLNSLMEMAGEDSFSSTIGPLAIDGLMLGGTIALLSIRALEMIPASPSIDALLDRWSVSDVIEGKDRSTLSTWGAEYGVPGASSVDEVLGAKDQKILQEWATEASAPVSAVPARAPRSSWDARMVAEMILSGAKTEEIEEKTGAKPASIGRFRKVARMIQTDPRITIDPKKEKVTSDNIRMIRELVAR